MTSADVLKLQLDHALAHIHEMRVGYHEWKNDGPEIADIYAYACEMWWKEARTRRWRWLNHMRRHGR